MPFTLPGFVVLVHRETGAESQPVPESTVPIWEWKGWRRRRDNPLDELVAVSEDLGLYDLDPQPAGDQIAAEGDEPHVPEGDDPTPHEED